MMDSALPDIKRGIRWKLLMVMLGLSCFLLTLVTWLQLSAQKEVLDNALAARTTLLKQALNDRAVANNQNIRLQVLDDLASYRFSDLSEKIHRKVRENPELIYVILLDAKNKIYIHTRQPALNHTIYQRAASHSLPAYANTKLPDGMTAYYILEGKEVHFLEYEIPIQLSTKPWGRLLLGYSLESLNKALSDIQAENEAALIRASLKTLYFSIFTLLLVYFVISKLADRLTAPIVALTAIARSLSGKNFYVDKEGLPFTKDEVGILANSIEDMADRLRSNYKQLEDYSVTLENKVTERTHALYQKNEALSKALKEIEEGQQQLIQSEKMAALGQLVAGVAHEINTPLGAIQASVGNAEKSLESFVTQLPSLIESSKKEQDLFLTLLDVSRPTESLTTREERKYKRKIVAQLDSIGIEDSENAAEMFVDMGLYNQIDQLLPFMKALEKWDVVTAAHCITGVNRSHSTIYTAITRASKVVYALKSYAHQDRSGQMAIHNIHEGINTVLVLYQNQLKQGCEVIKDFGDIPDIYCLPDELNQVWTNLIHNALQAMKNKGKLSIATRRLASDEIQVCITDTGPGIPDEIKNQIFDSFFSTKPAGEGTGLGLGICKRILDKHQGKIEVDSVPGRTQFKVTLPIHILDSVPPLSAA